MPRTRRVAAPAAAGISMLLLAAGAASAQSYTVRQLPTLGGFSAGAADINDAGVVVGWSNRASDGRNRAVKWVNGAISDLDPNGWWQSGEAVAINNNGFTLTNQQGATNCFPEGVQIFASTSTTPLWRMNYNNLPSAGRGLNASLHTVGCAAGAAGNMVPLRWNSTAPTAVGPASGVIADVLDINDAGLAVGHTSSITPTGVSSVSAVSIQGSQVSSLVAPATFARTHARGVNNAGLIVGDADNGTNPCSWLNVDSVAVKWSGSKVSTLPMPAAGGVWSTSATDVNDRGEIVGLGVRADWTFGPVLWRNAGDEAVFLTDLIRDFGGMMSIERVEAINNKGQMVGWGYQADTFRITPVVITPCWGNFNGTGGNTVQDVFDYLDAYFAASSRADVDRTGTVGPDDLFAFLGSYFTGCP